MLEESKLLSEEHYLALLATLTPKQLAVAALCLYHGLDYTDAVAILGISQRAALNRMQHARSRLLRHHPDLQRSLEP